jgi:hypothetical protein
VALNKETGVRKTAILISAAVLNVFADSILNHERGR